MLEWEDKYSVGIEEIDEQHKVIFEFGNNIWQIIHSEDEDKNHQMKAEIGKLVEYCEYHFEEEMAYMSKHKIKMLDNHISEHNRFYDKMKGVLQFDCSNVTFEECFDIMLFIVNWINDHILELDKRQFENHRE